MKLHVLDSHCLHASACIQSKLVDSLQTNLSGLGRTLSTGGSAPFRSFPKSLSLDFGGLSNTHNTLSSAAPPPATQDKYAALSQLDKVFSDNTPVTGETI